MSATTDFSTAEGVPAERPDAWVEMVETDGAVQVRVGGAWNTSSVAGVDADMRGFRPSPGLAVRFDFTAVEDFDTTGALIVYCTRQRLEAAGVAVELLHAPAHVTALIETVAARDKPCPEPPTPPGPFIALVNRVGQAAYDFGRETRNLLNFLGFTLIVVFRSFMQPERIRRTALVAHIEATGLNALPIIGLLNFLVGMVLAFQGADQLRRFGAEIFTINLVGVGVLREMGVLITAIILAGRSGSAFTAQIGTMTVNEEIDAMRTIGIDPMDALVVPRVVALMIALPLLTFYADIMGILGGAAMAATSLDITFFQFTRQLYAAVDVQHFWVGMIKAPIFAFIVAMVGCYEDLRVTRSAESVGIHTTKAVVVSIFLVIVIDAVAAIFFTIIGF